MRINSGTQVQHATFDGDRAGEGLAIFFSQGPLDVARYRFQVKAITDQGALQVGVFYSSPPSATTPTGPLTRAIAMAVCPGANSWAVDVLRVDAPVEGVLTQETSDLILTSTKCCTAPVGVTRVGERYIYGAGDSLGGADTVTVPFGRRIKSWTAVASGGTDGAVQMPSGTGAIIAVPAGFSANAEPGVFNTIETIVFTNVEYFIEYLEGA